MIVNINVVQAMQLYAAAHTPAGPDWSKFYRLCSGRKKPVLR